MKKLLILILVAALAMVIAPESKAQISMKSQYALTEDTVTNGATKYLTSSVINGYKKVVVVQFIATEISGTTGGTATLQGSLDGSNWYTIGSAYTLTDVATQSTSFSITDFGHLYLRVAVTGTGTMSDKIYAKFIARAP